LNIAVWYALALETINGHEHYLRFVFFSYLDQQICNVSNVLQNYMTCSDIMNFEQSIDMSMSYD